MTVTIDVINQGSLGLLKSMESMGLIHMQPPVSQETVSPPTQQTQEEKYPFLRLQGICKGRGGSVEKFLAECREDKERELAMEKRQYEERERLANEKIHP